jgi:hypothetical protein
MFSSSFHRLDSASLVEIWREEISPDLVIGRRAGKVLQAGVVLPVLLFLG